MLTYNILCKVSIQSAKSYKENDYVQNCTGKIFMYKTVQGKHPCTILDKESVHVQYGHSLMLVYAE